MLRSITEAFAHDDPDCPACQGDGMVCASALAEGHAMPMCADLTEWDCCAEGAPCPIFMAMHS